MKQRFYLFTFRSNKGTFVEQVPFRDTDQSSARLQAIVYSYKIEYYHPELAPIKVTAAH